MPGVGDNTEIMGTAKALPAVRFERITSSSCRLFSQGMRLYADSFPYHEQRRAESQHRIMTHAEYQYNAIVDGNKFVGLMLCWETVAFIYVEHFCISSSLRGMGYGARALALLAGRGKPVILEIDPPVDAISVRRKNFYERSGFVANPFPHVHPPYHVGFHGHNLVLMSFPRRFTECEYSVFAAYLSDVVMHNVFI